MPITYERDGEIANIVLTRPESLNAMDREMYRDANAAFSAFNDDEAAKVAVMSSACDTSFSAGVDIKDVHRALVDEKLPVEDVRELFSLFFETPGAITKPVIAALHGHCVGEGLVMSMFCDLRIAADDTTFALPEAKIGVPAINGTIRAVQLVGLASAMELLLTGGTRDADWALRAGLVNDIVPRGELKDQAYAWAKQIAMNDQAALAIMRKLGDRALQESFDELVQFGSALRDAQPTDAMVERQGNFINRRK